MADYSATREYEEGDDVQKNENPSPSVWPLIILILGAAAIAFAPIFVRVSEVGPVTTALWRVALAVPVLGGMLMFERARRAADAPLPVLGKREYVRLGLAGLFFAGDLAVWHYSIHFTSVANATLLANLAPIFVTLFGFILFKDRVTRLFIAGMAVALLGMMVLMGKSFSLSQQNFAGDLLGALTAVFYASYILAVGRLRARLGTIVVMFWSTVFTAVSLLPAVWLSGETLLPETAQGWGM
ncbi:MAG TPA: DMT family transporter, partial [Magnetovibrio sp.]